MIAGVTEKRPSYNPQEIRVYRAIVVVGVALTLLGLIALIGTYHPQTAEFTSFFMKAGTLVRKITAYLNTDPLSLSLLALTLGSSLWIPAAIYWSKR